MRERSRKRVLVTGAEGIVGRAIREHLAGPYELSYLTHGVAPFPSRVADVADLEAILPAFTGMDAVVHLAAATDLDAPWEDVLPANIVGTYNVLEAARRTAVPLVVLASSSHVVGMYEIEGAPRIFDVDDPRRYGIDAPLRPDSLYGVSKAFGEVLGRYYTDRYGLRVICLRIGAVREDDDPNGLEQLIDWPDKRLSETEQRARMRAIWMSRRDCVRLVAAALESDLPYAVVYGTSDDPRQVWDLRTARELGYEPLDAAPRGEG
jgi:nucleoside-diphosphate-sugar epimerase